MTQAGSVYGQALYALALEEGLTGQILSELEVLDQCFRQEPDFLRLLSSPNISKDERCQVLDDSFRGKVHSYVLNFLKLLTEKGFSKCFSDCYAVFEECYHRDNGILPVTACTAVALSQEQTDRLVDKLSRITGKQIKLRNRVDPALLGGVRLDWDGKRLDDTVSNRLDAVRSLLKDTVL